MWECGGGQTQRERDTDARDQYTFHVVMSTNHAKCNEPSNYSSMGTLMTRKDDMLNAKHLYTEASAQDAAVISSLEGRQ